MPNIDKDSICPICQVNFYDQFAESGRELGGDQIIESDPCRHIFHFGCISTWYNSENGNGTCPMCREPMFGGGADVTEDAYDQWYNEAYGHMLN